MGRTKTPAKRSKSNAAAKKARTKSVAAAQRRPDFYLDSGDWAYWREMPTVTLWEGVALSCGIKPQAITADGTFDEPDLTIFHPRLDVAKRAFPMTKFPDGVGLAKFARWAVKRQTPLWKRFPPQFRKLAQVSPEVAAEDKPLATKSRNIFLKLIAVLATRREGNYTLSQPHSDAVSLEVLMKTAGLKVSVRKIGDVLEEAARLLGSNRPEPKR
jgi:hypothetical protein